jgi:hypothetical protein
MKKKTINAISKAEAEKIIKEYLVKVNGTLCSKYF